LLSGKSAGTSGKGDKHQSLELATVVTPYILFVGLLILLSVGDHRLAMWSATPFKCFGVQPTQFR
jgi:hypothetical protein